MFFHLQNPIDGSNLGNNDQMYYFLYGPAHSPPLLPVWAQILILHLIAVVLAIGLFILRRYVISQLAQKHVAAPQRRYTVRRPNASTAHSTKQQATGATSRSRKNSKQSTGVGASSATKINAQPTSIKR